jgi:polysaccharide pyruvyl transferase CsaB
MHILMVTMSLGIGGAETHILELARCLTRCGHSVTVVSNGGVYVDALTADGVRHVDAPLHSKHPAALLRAYRTLRRLVREERFDAIHAHARIPGFLSAIVARRADVPFVTTFHGVFNPVWYWRLLTRTGERALAVSEDVREYLQKWYHMPADKITVTVNGIDVEAFRAGEPSAELLAPGRRTILCVTRLDRESAGHVYAMIEAMPEIVGAVPDARLVVVGGGDVLGDVRAAAADTDAALGGGRIEVLGPRTDIPAILPAADLFVGVSRAAMEAMACGIPVILSGAQGHLGAFVPILTAEAVGTNFCCRGRDVADADTLADAVITVLKKTPEERREMGAYGRALIEREYSVARMAGDAETVYARAIREHVFRRGDAVVSGYYGFGNAGDDALLTAIAEGLRARGIYRISALSKNGKPPAPGVRAVRRFRFFAVRREIRRAKLLISGGGSLLQDATSTQSLVYYTAVMRCAERAGVPVMVLANGVGPISREKNRRRAARAVAAADAVSVREEQSREELVSMGIDAARIRVSADPVFRLGTPRPAQTERPYLLLSLRETADGRRTRALEDALFAAARDLCREADLDAVVLPMQPAYDDGICARMAERLREAGVSAEKYGAASFGEIRARIAGARCVIAMRLHALIFACAACVPPLALSYDPKIDAFMEYVRMRENVLPAFSADGEEILAAARRLLASRETLRAALAERTEEMCALSEKDFDVAAALFAGKTREDS